MANADSAARRLLFRPTDPIYDESIRQFQGCPTIAVTRGGRIYAGWYSGGTREPHIDNYNLVVYSDDAGASWSKPILVIPSDRETCVQALDIQLWTAPNGSLYVFWVQNNVQKVDPALDGQPGRYTHEVDGYLFGDREHAAWMSICENPDDADPVFSPARFWDHGFLRCKPLVLTDGTWLLFDYDQLSDRYGYSISKDEGKTFTRCYGAKKIRTPFDETMAYEKRDGTVRMLARSSVGELAQSFSHDGGETWDETQPSGIDNPNTRFFVGRTPTGRILLVNNDHRTSRTNMAVYLPEDDGETWKYKRIIDTRPSLSYPDVDYRDGRICLVYDRERTGAKEILFLSFTEEDIMNDSYVFTPSIISKP